VRVEEDVDVCLYRRDMKATQTTSPWLLRSFAVPDVLAGSILAPHHSEGVGDVRSPTIGQ